MAPWLLSAAPRLGGHEILQAEAAGGRLDLPRVVGAHRDDPVLVIPAAFAFRPPKGEKKGP